MIEFRGQAAFDEKTLRSELKEQITTIDEYGLTPARGDDAQSALGSGIRDRGLDGLHDVPSLRLAGEDFTQAHAVLEIEAPVEALHSGWQTFGVPEQLVVPAAENA